MTMAASTDDRPTRGREVRQAFGTLAIEHDGGDGARIQQQLHGLVESISVDGDYVFVAVTAESRDADDAVPGHDGPSREVRVVVLDDDAYRTLVIQYCREPEVRHPTGSHPGPTGCSAQWYACVPQDLDIGVEVRAHPCKDRDGRDHIRSALKDVPVSAFYQLLDLEVAVGKPRHLLVPTGP